MLDFEVTGPIARTVADARLLFDVMRGPAPVDPQSMAAAHAASQLKRKASLRILYVERFGNAPLDPQMRKTWKFFNFNPEDKTDPFQDVE